MNELFGIDLSYYILGLFIVIFILIISFIIMTIKIKTLTNKYNSFMNGKEAESLEEVILERFNEIDYINAENKEINNSIKKIKENLTIAYQKIGIVKYDAFKEMGGKLSFSLAILNDKNNGIVLNSVHSRDGCYTYIKDIENGESDILLSEEEKEAIKLAMRK